MHNELMDFVSIGSSGVQKYTEDQRVTEFVEEDSHKECQTLRCKVYKVLKSHISGNWEQMMWNSYCEVVLHLVDL